MTILLEAEKKFNFEKIIARSKLWSTPILLGYKRILFSKKRIVKSLESETDESKRAYR
jgi:hypothetical protein